MSVRNTSICSAAAALVLAVVLASCSSADDAAPTTAPPVTTASSVAPSTAPTTTADRAAGALGDFCRDVGALLAVNPGTEPGQPYVSADAVALAERVARSAPAEVAAPVAALRDLLVSVKGLVVGNAADDAAFGAAMVRPASLEANVAVTRFASSRCPR